MQGLKTLTVQEMKNLTILGMKNLTKQTWPKQRE